VNYAPESSLDNAQLEKFVDSLREYQGWIEEMQGKSVEFAGVADSIMPHLEMYIESNRMSVDMDGFYVSFERGIINRDTFDDRLYLKLSGTQLERHKIAPGDRLELLAYFTESRGRIILRKPRRIEVSRNGGKADINFSRALVGRATGRIIGGSVAYCRGCPYVSLVDVANYSRRSPVHYRRFYCLRGVEDSENCPVRLSALLPSNSRENTSQRRF